MKLLRKSIIPVILFVPLVIAGRDISVSSPDGRLSVTIASVAGGRLTYAVTYDGVVMLDPSPMGFVADTGDFVDSVFVVGSEIGKYADDYILDRCKVSEVHYRANELRIKVENRDGNPMSILFRVSDNDIAFRYEVPRLNGGETGSIVIKREATGFDFPSETSVFLTPQSHAMADWKRTKPSYEEEYQYDTPMSMPSAFGHGYTFPGLFRIGDRGWVLVSETGLDRRYCGTRLSDMKDGGLYTIEMPMPEENNGNGTSSPAFALPGCTPWRTLTVSDNLAPIVETTAPWDNVSPRYTCNADFRYGKGTWSWILWQDGSINIDDQRRFIDLAADMGYDYTLIDNWWDTRIGMEGIESLAEYAKAKGIGLFLWYSSSGYWNDIVQGPTSRMDSPIERKTAMKWMNSIGIKGIKVDFFGGDKQETIRLYEDILSDAADYGLMVIFHGCTIPRGWERMYPNYVGSEAVLASENNIFGQHHCDREAQRSALHPFCRNAIGCMEYGGSFLSRRMARGNDSGNIRRTTDGHSVATSVTFQNPIQNFALAPENLLPEEEGGASAIAIDFMRRVPTTWDETRLVDGYPGRYVVLARRHGNTWYVAGTNAADSALTLNLDLSRFVGCGQVVTFTGDSPADGRIESKSIKVEDSARILVTICPQGGFVIESTKIL